MQELVRLVTLWASFAEKHPDANVEDFCLFIINEKNIKIINEKSRKAEQEVPLNAPQDLDGRFMRALTRTTLSYWVYMRIALRDTEIKSLENFTFMASLSVQGEAKKTSIINYAMMEFTTGIEILNRLIKMQLIKERIDPGDKRSRLLSLTPKGDKVLQQCFSKARLARDILLKNLSDKEKEICMFILEPIHIKHASLAMKSKSKTIEEIYAEVLGTKRAE